MDNADIAAALAEVADHLERRGENPYKVQAYRRGAETVAALGDAIGERYRSGGLDALEALPHIGDSLARAIAELLAEGRLALLAELRAESAEGDEELPF